MERFLKIKVVKLFAYGWDMIVNTWVIEEGRFASKDEMRSEWAIFKKKRVKTHYGGAILSKKMYSFLGIFYIILGACFR
jgi:hypothetical protein